MRLMVSLIVSSSSLVVMQNCSCPQKPSGGLPTTLPQGGEDVLRLAQPGVEPVALRFNVDAEVVFTCIASGARMPLAEIVLEEVRSDGKVLNSLGRLRDDGQSPDLVSGDTVYSAKFPIRTSTEGRRCFSARGEYLGGSAISAVCEISITWFPIGPVPSDPSKLLTDSATGQRVYADEGLVAFVEATSSDRIKAIVNGKNATIVGTIPNLQVFPLRIRGDAAVAGVTATIKALQAYSEVKYAEPNYAVEVDDR